LEREKGKTMTSSTLDDGAAGEVQTSVPRGSDDLATELLSLVASARGLDVRKFEKGSASDALQELVPRVIAAVEGAIGLCQEVLAAYEETSEDADTDEWADEADWNTSVYLRRMDEASENHDASCQVANFAFIGKTALIPKRAALEQLGPGRELWSIISECDGSRRRIVKTLTMLESALARTEGRETRLALSSELNRSLETRRRYARLRKTFLVEEFSPKRAGMILRRSKTAIAILIGHDVYPELRITDRRQLRSLQARIADWLQAPKEPDSVLVAQRLFQDLGMFAGLITHVNHREELHEHDIEAVARLLESPDAEQTSERERETLDSLRGVNDELDALLDAAPLERSAWLPVVRKLEETMSATGGGSF